MMIEIVQNILNTIAGLSLIASILYIIYTISDLGIKLYGNLVRNIETKFKWTNQKAIVFWIALTIIIYAIL